MHTSFRCGTFEYVSVFDVKTTKDKDMECGMWNAPSKRQKILVYLFSLLFKLVFSKKKIIRTINGYYNEQKIFTYTLIVLKK